MNIVARVLQKHDGKPHFNAKVLQHAARYDSKQSAYNLIRDGVEKVDWFAELLRRLDKSGARPVVHDMLREICDDLDLDVVARDRHRDEPPVRLSVRATELLATFTRELLDALADNVVCDREDARLEPMLCELERMIAQLRDVKNKRRRPPVRMAQ